ncbi:MAG: tetratricopeptide repeat protein [Rhodospirillaceae bacterium]|nr:tetratricopeptide repeat protein [Rhodospirillaceae bacterium]
MSDPTKPGQPDGQKIATLLQQAVGFHQAGRAAEAARLYNDVLNFQPDNPDALHLLGVLAHQNGDNLVAVDLIKRAIEIHSDQPLYRNNLGLALASLGRHEEAIPHYRNALAGASSDLGVHCNLANAYQALDRHADAVEAYQNELTLSPDNIMALANLGISLSRLGRHEEAVSIWRRGLAIAPNDPDLLCNVGIALQESGRFEEAISSFKGALSAAPESVDAHMCLGNILQKLNRHEDAIACFERALSLAPDNSGALNNLGYSLVALNRPQRAVELYQQAIAITPENAEFHNNLGNAYEQLRLPEKAVASYENALALDPLHSNALSHLSSGKRKMCDWDGMEKIDETIIDHVKGDRVAISPFSFLTVTDDPALQLSCASQFQKSHQTGKPFPSPTVTATGRKKLRVGYFSDTFRRHAISYLIVQLLELHDRSRFEICGFSYSPDDQSPIRRRIEASFDAFHDVSQQGDDELAHSLQASDLDILVDLNGHTDGSRLSVLARRPAPIQAHFLGYPGTLGADFIDYLFVDEYLVPRDQAHRYAENLIWLPDSYQVNDRKRAIAETTPSRADCGLPADGFVFCCFNQTSKITPSQFDIWMRLLQTIPGSVLWLLHDNEMAERNLRREAQTRHVDPTKLVFAPRADLPEHLARHRLADLFLDTLPYNAHTTASDALWMGLPVLTCSGRSMAARVAGSLLRAIGLPELVTGNLDDYEASAHRLATEPDTLNAIRSKLEANRLKEPLFDTDRFRRHIEEAYERMWTMKQSGEPPRSFAVSPVADVSPAPP